VTALEWILAGLLTLLGLRSLVYWLRRPIHGGSLLDHVLFSLFVTGRVALWFTVAGIFAISAVIGGSGKGFLDEFEPLRWYILVPLALAAVQLVTGFLLGRSRTAGR
jgi:hypothetical protein